MKTMKKTIITSDSSVEEILVKGEMVPISTLSYSEKLYWQRRNSHLCVGCGVAVEDGKAHCPDCRTRRSEQGKQNRIFYSSLGLCSVCGRNRVFGNKKMCPECRAFRAESYRHISEKKKADQAKKKSEYNRKRYQEHVKQGVCTICCRRKAEEGKTRCNICAYKDLVRHQRAYREKHLKDIPRGYRIQNGLCYKCGRSLDMDGKKVCSICYKQITEALEKARFMRRQKTEFNWDGNIIFQKKALTTALDRRALEIFHTAPYAGEFSK